MTGALDDHLPVLVGRDGVSVLTAEERPLLIVRWRGEGPTQEIAREVARRLNTFAELVAALGEALRELELEETISRQLFGEHAPAPPAALGRLRRLWAKLNE